MVHFIDILRKNHDILKNLDYRKAQEEHRDHSQSHYWRKPDNFFKYRYILNLAAFQKGILNVDLKKIKYELGASGPHGNPSYLGSRDQRHRGLRPPGKQLARPYVENTQYKKGLAEWLKWYSASLASIRA
jgi:hypothetical protein